MTINKTELQALNNSPENVQESQGGIKVYTKRWFILLLFILYSNTSFLQNLEYCIVADVIVEYYQTSYDVVDWSALITSAAFVVFGIPLTYFLDVYGLRKTLLVGSVGTAIGVCIKIGSVSPDRFWLILLGQGIVAIFQITIFPLLPKVAATWFNNDQIAVACGLGILGVQLGNGLSCLIPPSIVYQGKVEEVAWRLYVLNIIYAAIAVLLVPFIYFFFTDKPPTPPSVAQQESLKEQFTHSKSLWEITITLFKMKSFMIYLMIFGVNLGITWPLQILSNQVILFYYPDAAYDVGIIGLVQVMVSVIGSMGVSAILDKYKKFKLTCWSVHGVYLISLAIYIATLDQGIACIYITSALVGVLMGALMTLGMELIMEFSYPEAEGIPVTFVYWWAQVLSLGLTYLCGYLLRTVNALWANIMLIIFVVVVDLLFFILKFDLKRNAIQQLKSNNMVANK